MLVTAGEANRPRLRGCPVGFEGWVWMRVPVCPAFVTAAGRYPAAAAPAWRDGVG